MNSHLHEIRRSAGLAVAAVICGCAPHLPIPPVPATVPSAADSATRSLAMSLAPTLLLQRDEPFPLVRVVAVVHPTRPIIAYDLLWRHDVNGQWLPWTKPSDEEIVWIGYDSTTGAPTQIWTYWHGRILHTMASDAHPAIKIQWGKHGSLPAGIIESDVPHPQTLNAFYALEFVLLPDILLGKIAHGGPWGFFHSYKRYRDFSTVLPLRDRLDAVVRTDDPRPALRILFGRDYSNKRLWP